MSARRLSERSVRKPWGRRYLPPPFRYDRRSIGEVWFEDPDGGDPELLVKFLFTSEKLSIQVHPDDEAARAAGYRRGKDEAWLVLAAEPDAVIGLGLRRALSREELRQAVLDGAIEELIDWRPVKAGDVLCSPAGTIHAIGPGLTIVEVQQNVDLTYRLFDYGRPRELHVAEALEAAEPRPGPVAPDPVELGPHRTALAAGSFVLERWHGPVRAEIDCGENCPVSLVPLKGEIALDGELIHPGTVWTLEGEARMRLAQDAELLATYRSAEPIEGMIRIVE